MTTTTPGDGGEPFTVREPVTGLPGRSWRAAVIRIAHDWVSRLGYRQTVPDSLAWQILLRDVLATGQANGWTTTEPTTTAVGTGEEISPQPTPTLIPEPSPVPVPQWTWLDLARTVTWWTATPQQLRPGDIIPNGTTITVYADPNQARQHTPAPANTRHLLHVYPVAPENPDLLTPGTQPGTATGTTFRVRTVPRQGTPTNELITRHTKTSASST